MAIKINHVGKFDRRIKAQRLSSIQTSEGNIIESWSDAYETWASVSDIKSYRDQLLLQNVTVSTYTVQIRLTPTHEVSKNIRFVYEGRNMILQGQPIVFTEGRKRYYQFILAEQE